MTRQVSYFRVDLHTAIRKTRNRSRLVKERSAQILIVVHTSNVTEQGGGETQS